MPFGDEYPLDPVDTEDGRDDAYRETGRQGAEDVPAALAETGWRIAAEHMDAIPEHYCTHPTDVYEAIYTAARDELEDVRFDASDLQALVDLDANHGTGGRARAYGMYTGVLLHLLTERERAAGGEARVHIDGGGTRFNYLFHGAHEIDTVFVENLQGKETLAWAASHGGSAGTIAMRNVTGDQAASWVGGYEGSLDRGIFTDVTGTRAVSTIGGGEIIRNEDDRFSRPDVRDGGDIGTLVHARVDGYSAGANHVHRRGRLERAMYVDCTGQHLGEALGHHAGVVGPVHHRNVAGFEALRKVDSEEFDRDAYTELVERVDALEGGGWAGLEAVEDWLDAFGPDARHRV